MGIKELKQGAMTKERLKDILALRKAKEYDKILDIYGPRLYRLAVPNKYKKKDIKDLLASGRFEDIYRKYGKRTYNDYKYVMEQIDVYNETGSKTRSVLNRVKNILLHRIAPFILSGALLAPPTFIVTMDYGRRKENEKNAIEYAQQIESYNSKIEEYAKVIRSMKLTDTQIFTKVMKDMWEEIDGYKNPEKEIMGFLRLSLDSEGVGVCRNFADDITAKLNEINPEYNARNITVYMDENEYRLANIERNIVEDNETVVNENNGETNSSGIDFTKLTGNHMVTAVDIPGKNITLILDPTNPSIGVFKDGKIHMFSTPNGKGIDDTMIGQLILNGISETFEFEKDKIQSFLPCEYSLEELEEIYGIDAQNNALEYLAELEEKANPNKEFVPKVKVDERKAIREAKVDKENVHMEEMELK